MCDCTSSTSRAHALLRLPPAQKDEQRYLLNTLYINDYCCWVQVVPDDVLEGAAAELRHLCGTLDVGAIRWPLKALEDGESVHDDESDDGGDGGDTSGGSSSEEGDAAGPAPPRPLIVELPE